MNCEACEEAKAKDPKHWVHYMGSCTGCSARMASLTDPAKARRWSEAYRAVLRNFGVEHAQVKEWMR